MRRVVLCEVTQRASPGLFDSFRSSARIMTAYLQAAYSYTECLLPRSEISRVMILEESFRFNRGHAAGARGRYGLAINVILHVAACEHTFDVRERAVVRHKISGGIHFQFSHEWLRVGVVADGDEHSRGGNNGDFICS